MYGPTAIKNNCNLRYHYIIFATAFLVLTWQFVFPGYYHIAYDDAVFGPKYTLQFNESLRQGIFYPRWMAKNFNGYGSPTFVFYSPLLFFLSAILDMTSLGLVWSKTLLELLRLYVGGLFLFLLVKKHQDEKTAIISAVLYMSIPTRFLDIYFINTQAGRFAQAWMPMSLLFTGKYMEEPFRQRNLALMSFSYAALILSHIATAYIFTPFLLAYGMLAANLRLSVTSLLKVSSGIGVGILLSSFYFLPATLERCHTQLGLLEHLFPFEGNFIFNLLHSTRDENQAGLVFMTRNAVIIEVCLFSLIVYIAKRLPGASLNRHAKFSLGAMLFCIFMMSSPSVFLWSHLPGLSTVALPFRFTAIYIIFYSTILGILLRKILDQHRSSKPLTYMLITVLAVVILYESNIVSHSYRYTEDKVRSLLQVAEMPEYLPGAAKMEALGKLRQEDPLLSSVNGVDLNVTRWDYTGLAFSVSAEGPAAVRVKTFYFPGWNAWVDGRKTAIGVENMTGAMIVDVPSGKHQVTLRFTNTPTRTIGTWLSLITLAVLVFPYRRFRGLSGQAR